MKKKKIPEETQTTQRETLISGIFHEAAGRQVEPPDQNPPLKNAKWEPRRQKKFSAREKKTEWNTRRMNNAVTWWISRVATFSFKKKFM